ncbi:MAG: hypothetical protein HZC28_00750 [Spirochaetes bacterium]|nr:hypothetical protein [Spirochaetota bacterium]
MKSFILLFAAVFALAAKPSDTVRFSKSEVTEIEASFFADIDDGTLSKYTLYDAFLIASEICDTSIFPGYQKKLMDIRAKAIQELGPSRGEDPYVLGKKLLFWMHDNVLKKYQATATVAYTIIDSGEYNCLSASILYGLLATDLGLTVVGVMVPDHAFCMLKDTRGDKDIETTARYGFDPGTKEIEQLKNETRYIYVPKNSYASRDIVSIQQLIAALYGNRISLLQRSTSAYDKDLPKYKKGYYLDPQSKLFSENIIGCYNNLALFAIQKNEFDDALSYIKQGKAFAPANPSFKDLAIQRYDAMAKIAAKTNDYKTAIELLRPARTEYPEESLPRQNTAYYYTTWGRTYFITKDYKKAVVIFEAGFKDVADPVLVKNLRASYYNLAVEAYNKGRFDEAIRYCDAGLSYVPSDAELLKLKQYAKQKR